MISNINNFYVIGSSNILPFRLENGFKAANGKVKGYTDYRKSLDNKNFEVSITTFFSPLITQILTD